MAHLEWNETLSVHVQEFDEHHKRIIAMINDLHDCMEQVNDDDGAVSLVHRLIDYASTHFKAEERYMMQYGFAGYEFHETEHDRFIEQVLGFQQRLNRGDRVISEELMTFLKNWLVKHILGTDRQYSQFFHDRGLR